MKALFKSLIVTAATVAALVSCSKEVNDETPVATKQNVSFKFYANPAGVGTRATLTPNATETSFAAAWEDEETMDFAAFSADAEFDELGFATWSAADEAFTAEFPDVEIPQGSHEWLYYAYYPRKESIPFDSPRTQWGNAYNSQYDVMYGETDVVTGELGKDAAGDPVEVPMSRLTGIAYFHITGGPNEDVVYATLSAEGIAAEIVNIEYDGSAPAATVPAEVDRIDEITINFADGTAPKASDLQLWFNVLPGTYSNLKLTIVTESHIAVLGPVGPATYSAGKLNKAVLGNLQWQTTYYEKVMAMESVPDGQYLIVYEGGNVAFDGSREELDAVGNTISVDFLDGFIIPSGNINGAVFTWDSTNGYLKSARGYYIGRSSDENGLSTSASPNYTNTITVASGEAAIISHSAHLRYNKTSGQTRFRYFKASSYSQQQPVALYKLCFGTPAVDTRTPVTLSFDPANPAAIKLNDNFTEPTLVADPQAAAASVIYSVETNPAEIATINESTGKLNITDVGTITVTAAIPDGDETYKPASASYTLTVKGETPEGYELITSDSEVTTGLYVIAAKVGDTYYAMTNTFSSKIDGEEVTVTDGVIQLTDAEDYSLTITNVDNNQYRISGANGLSLGYRSSTNFSTTENGNAALWTIETKNVHGTFRIANVRTNSRGVIFTTDSGNNRFGAYATSNVTGSASYYDVELFKYNGDAPAIKSNPTTTVTPASISLEVEGTQQLVVETDSDGAITYESSDEDVATVTSTGLVEAIAAGNATITVRTAATEAFYSGSTEIHVSVIARASTIAEVIAGGEGTYQVPNVTVYAVKGSGLVIGDATAKMYAYAQNHGLSVGAVRTFSGQTTMTSNDVYEFNNPTITGTGTATVNHGTAVEIDQDAATLQTAFTNAGNLHTAVYIHAIGTQSGRNITTSGGTKLYLSANESSTNDKTVEIYGYIYAYSTAYSNFNLLVTSIEEYVDPNAPALSVSPASASWGSGENDEKTFEVTAVNGTWAITSNGVSDWADVVANTTDNTIKVTPKTDQAAQANSGEITVTLTPTGSYEPLTATISLSQAKYGGGDPTTDTYTFLSKSWTATLNGNAANWTSDKDGAGFADDQGVQVTSNSSGANATSPVSFSGVSRIVVTYNTNKSAGAGSIAVQVGSNAEVSQDVQYGGSGDGRSQNYTVTYDFDPSQDGNVKITVYTSTNSIYVKSIAITHN